MSHSQAIRLTVNGQVYERQVEPRILLSDFLRHELDLNETTIRGDLDVGGKTFAFPVRS